MHAGVDIEFGHAGADIAPRPGVAGLARPHAGSQRQQFVFILLSPHCGNNIRDRLVHRMPQAIVHAFHAELLESAIDRQLSGPLPRC